MERRKSSENARIAPSQNFEITLNDAKQPYRFRVSIQELSTVGLLRVVQRNNL